LSGIHTLATCVHDAAKGDDAPACPWEVDWCQPIALLVGNEGAGLPEEIVHSADARIHIPMAARVESLNAAAAAAVLFYEAFRQRAKPL
jgi:tRNA G18 (ribose-2'-O)-methylase SpoU